MSGFLVFFLLLYVMAIPVEALEFTAPSVPESAEEYMPNTDIDFQSGLLELFRKVLNQIRPDINEAVSVCLSVVGVVIIISIVLSFQNTSKTVTEYAGVIAVASILFFNANTMIQLGGNTISELSEYGKLLFPVMTTAMAAQGKITTSAAIYTGATAFSSLTCALIAKIFLPSVYFYLAISAANSAIADDMLKNLRDLLKQMISWSLKTLLTIFTTYISITGAVSGTTDAAALKATKVTISSFVPVVGGILSDASEAVLVSVGMAKNVAGIYGIFAILAVFLKPFLLIGSHYLMLKILSGICSILGTKRIYDLIGDFSVAMGLLLAMTGTICILLLVSTICFMRGVG